MRAGCAISGQTLLGWSYTAAGLELAPPTLEDGDGLQDQLDMVPDPPGNPDTKVRCPGCGLDVPHRARHRSGGRA